jgi:acetyl-CoA carboxylase biotin carboxylase subunit
MPMFRKLLIANRGEIAVRIVRACQELGIGAVAVYSDADAQARHVRLADEAICIGPAPAGESYLRGERIVEAARATGCNAVHPGYGFLAESPAFARQVQAAGLVFIGPPAEAIERMGIKTQARALMQAAGVPVAPGFAHPAATLHELMTAAEGIGYPVMVKAAGGGGGIGLQVVQEPAALPDAVAAARRAAQQAFGDPALFLEKYIPRARHIEVQILADCHGNVAHLFERDCSVQRRHQKVIEESPSPFLNAGLRAAMGEAAVAAARAAGYTNAGTVEFIVDAEGRFYFLEMNTRLQVEHAVTELLTGVDLVRAQIAIAAGQPLPFAQVDLVPRGHAVECRINAEDPAQGFLPTTGTVLGLVEPSGPGVRVDAGIAAGDEVSVHYDPLLAKVIVWAEERDLALRRMQWALDSFILLGLTTNLEFLRDVLRHPLFAAGGATTEFLAEQMQGWQPQASKLDDIALIAAALADATAGGQAGALPGHRVQHDAQARGCATPWQRDDGFRLGGQPAPRA